MLASCASATQGAGKAILTPTPTATGAIDPLCSQFRIVALSHADTEDTKAQVIANNAVYAAVCGPVPGPSRKNG
jgi:hypothetical protein